MMDKNRACACSTFHDIESAFFGISLQSQDARFRTSGRHDADGKGTQTIVKKYYGSPAKMVKAGRIATRVEVEGLVCPLTHNNMTISKQCSQ